MVQALALLGLGGPGHHHQLALVVRACPRRRRPCCFPAFEFFFYNGECDAVGSVLPQGTENHQLYAKKWDNERDFFDSSRTWQFSNLVRSTDDVRLQDSTSRRAGSFSPTPRPEVQTFVCSCKNHASPCIVIHMHVWGWPEPDTCPFKKKKSDPM